MHQTKILTTHNDLATEFARCCKEYTNLDMAVAWCGDPKNVIPFSHIKNFAKRVRIVVGIAFNQTHPDAISFLQNMHATIHIFKEDNPLFHPKLYMFSSGKKRALIFGSSNFTYNGFFINTEVNVLIEGSQESLQQIGLKDIGDKFEKWCTDEYSFKPDNDWLALYRKDYNARRKAERRSHLKTPVQLEENIPSASWLKMADWSTYIGMINEGLRKNNRGLSSYFAVLDAAERELKTPWATSVFDTIEKRRIIGGYKKGDTDYGWLGHVGASGGVRHLLSNGTEKEKETMIRALNTAAAMNPIDWTKLQSLLKSLVNLGPTIKVWGRLLCLVRPDAYCTIASESVRSNLAKNLNVSKKAFLEPDGYIRLLKLIHSSPWFNSPQPKNDLEKKIWKRRMALIDAIFY